MENVFVDTNIIIDLLAKREPFYKDAQDLFTLAPARLRAMHTFLTCSIPSRPVRTGETISFPLPP